MKKLLIVIAIACIAIGTNAQKPVTIPKPGSGIIKVDPKANPKVTNKWIFDVKKLPLNDKAYMKDLTANLRITLEVKEYPNRGKALYFYSSMPISKIVLTFGDKQKDMVEYKPSLATYFFFLETAAYKSGLKTGYKLLFYVKGIEEPVAEGEAMPLTIVN